MVLRAKTIWVGIGLLYVAGGIQSVSTVSPAYRSTAVIIEAAPIKVTAQSAQNSLSTGASLRAIAVGF
jgi:hypothetical protein